MDLNKDGNLDILSGSYDSYSDKNPGGMLGEFHVFYGNSDGSYQLPVAMQNRDGDSLAIETDFVGTICTRPYAVDLNSDGNLDIVAGNKSGGFFLFPGDDSGQYSNSSTPLTGPDNQPLKLNGHSDPYFVDWDADGDQDMFSGDHKGGVYFFENTGDKFTPAFSKPVVVVDPAFSGETPLYSSGITRPQRGTRMTVADVNQDGKLDLLVGDVASIYSPAEGLTEAECLEQLAQWQPKWNALVKENDEKGLTGMNRYESESALRARHAEIVSQEAGGFVWLYLQK